ncbi:MAG TPA: hypothetical protein VMC85_18555 [Desulfomonilaceae bacterium]|nr:hypothetical protein [Desulfomonilaceae bacterium]
MTRKKRLVGIFILIGIAAIIITCIIPVLNENINSIALRKNQQELAQYLGVKINDYEGPDVFPVMYFDSVLKPGMPSDEVHQIVRGYDQVLFCFGNTEIYYYFSTEDNTAIRFGIEYDDQGKYIRLEGENPRERLLLASSKDALAAGSCVYGLFGK